MLRFRSIAPLLPFLFAAACGGDETTVLTSLTNPTDPADLDDSPPSAADYDPSLSYTGRLGPQNNSNRRFRFDVAAYRDDTEHAEHERLYATHADALRAHPTAIPSVQTVGTYLKQLDDTIYAGVEHAAQDGLAPTLTPKREVLSAAIAYLAEHRSADGDEAIQNLAAAIEPGGGAASVPYDLAARVADRKRAFLDAPLVSTPIGFYTWSNELKAIWQQDRMLQEPLMSGAACAMAAALGADAKKSTKYVSLTELYAKLTNPLRPSVVHLLGTGASCAEKADEKRHAFLAASRTPEVALFEKLYPMGVPPSADLMEDLIKAIRAGSISLTPEADTGWYGHQLFALETLLVTDKSEERRKVAFTAKYKRRLKDAFKTMLTQHRETHVKQTDTIPASAPRRDVPELRTEPLATVYARHARSYVFLEKALDPILGEGWLDKASAFGDKGKEEDTLRERIHRARDLFYGLYITSSQDIGFKPKLDQAGDPESSTWGELAAAADTWSLKLADDALAQRDVRVMIPIASLPEKRAKYWAVIGVRTTLAAYSYLGDDGKPKDKLEDIARIPLPTEQLLEVTSSTTPLTREELRALCDEKKTAEAIKAALEAR